jgi:predicted nucleic acid-binding protein
MLVDTCVLLEATNRARSQHRAAREPIERHEGLVIPAQVAHEFLVAATHPPANNGLGLGLLEALESLVGIREHVRLLPEEKPLLPTATPAPRAVSYRGQTDPRRPHRCRGHNSLRSARGHPEQS